MLEHRENKSVGCRGNQQLAEISVEIRQCRTVYSVRIMHRSYEVGTAYPDLFLVSTRFIAQCSTNKAQLNNWADIFVKSSRVKIRE